MTDDFSSKAALRGEPSYVWRGGQERRLQMILDAAGERHGALLELGCGVGMYLQHLAPHFESVTGIDIELERLAAGPHAHAAPGRRRRRAPALPLRPFRPRPQP